MTVVADSVINYSVATKDVSYGVEIPPGRNIKATSVIAFIAAIKDVSYGIQIPPGRNIKATSAILYGLGTHARSAGNQQVNNAPNQVWVG